MKNFRVLLTAMVFALAIGAAFATSLLPVNNGYIMTGQPVPCSLSAACNNTSGSDCESGGQAAFDGSIQSSTSCGTRLQKIQ